jgi:hypothetical protein
MRKFKMRWQKVEVDIIRIEKSLSWKNHVISTDTPSKVILGQILHHFISISNKKSNDFKYKRKNRKSIKLLKFPYQKLITESH